MQKIAAALIIMTVLTACNGTVGDFVGGATPTAPINSQDPPPGLVGSGAAIRISPGYVKSTSGPIGLEASVSPTKRVITDGSVSAEITFGKTRTQ